MIKFVINAENNSSGKHVVGLGLCEKNLEMLQKGSPIIFPCSEVGIDDKRGIVIIFDDDDSRPQWEELLSPTKVAFCLCIDDDAFATLRGGETLTNVTEKVEFVFMYGKTQDDLTNMLKPAIGPETQVTTKGFEPSDPTNNIQGQN